MLDAGRRHRRESIEKYGAAEQLQSQMVGTHARTRDQRDGLEAG
jgi:hypothetical protein